MKPSDLNDPQTKDIAAHGIVADPSGRLVRSRIDEDGILHATSAAVEPQGLRVAPEPSEVLEASDVALDDDA